ncbi:MAG TPA: hypothetical protein DHV55_13950 [Clostridiaceae bacterium]|nr:hypothetical protein [Clostridiaceae bacterium]
MSGEYEDRSHILGEIAYVDYIERENAARYLSRIKKYISDTAMKVVAFPELVEAYNKNLLFNDLVHLKPQKIEVEDDEEFAYYSNVFEERKMYLQKNNMEDICRYSDWPLPLLSKDELQAISS